MSSVMFFYLPLIIYPFHSLCPYVWIGIRAIDIFTLSTNENWCNFVVTVLFFSRSTLVWWHRKYVHKREYVCACVRAEIIGMIIVCNCTAVRDIYG